MKLGVIIPQGWVGDYDGWDPLKAWARSVMLAALADDLGIESIWVFDHFHTVPRPTDEITFESFTMLSALAAVTTRVRLGHVVICTAFRNPALTAKMISTMDVISGGRMELGIGAGWKRDEWDAYGYGFPETSERLARLADDLERGLADDGRRQAPARDVRGPVLERRERPQHPQADPAAARADHGRRQRAERHVASGREVRRRAQPRRDGAPRRSRPPCRRSARGARRSAATRRRLDISVHMWWDHIKAEGQERVDRLAGFRELGVNRVMGLVPGGADSDEPIEMFAAAARESGAEMA